MLSRFLDDYYKQFESRTEKMQLASSDQVAQETVSLPRLNIHFRNIFLLLRYFLLFRGFVQDNYPVEQTVESSER